MPINKDQKLIINGEPAEPSKKAKVPPSFDWQALVRQKQLEAEKKESSDE